MWQYEIHNKVKRRGRMETVLMTKYVLSQAELDGIIRYLDRIDLDDVTVANVRMAIIRTQRLYERKYRYDPVAPDGSLAFILFKPDAIWLQDNCLNKLFTY